MKAKKLVIDEILVNTNSGLLKFKSKKEYKKFQLLQLKKAIEIESKGYISIKLTGLMQTQNSNV